MFIGPEDKIGGIDKSLYARMKDTGAAVFTGFTNEVPKYISGIDVLVHPSYREGFSMVIQQAMAMKIAVVTTDIPGPSEVIGANRSGLLAKAKDIASLTDAMEKYILMMSSEILLPLRAMKELRDSSTGRRCWSLLALTASKYWVIYKLNNIYL